MKNFLTKVTQILGDFWAVKKSPFLRLLFGQLLEKIGQLLFYHLVTLAQIRNSANLMATRSTKFRLIFGQMALLCCIQEA